MRAQARAEGRSDRLRRPLARSRPGRGAAGRPPVIRLKAPRAGETVIEDRVQGEVRFANAQLDDMVLLRSDGTPTYMLSVVVDDHDMAITHIIRGDDHLVNAARQMQLYRALDWHAAGLRAHPADPRRRRRQAVASATARWRSSAYREMGFLPEAMRNYLLRLGWSHGDDEIIPTEQAIAWFDLDAVGRGAARFDMARLTSLNAHYLRQMRRRRARRADRAAPRGRGAARRRRRRGRGSRRAWPGSSRARRTLVDLAERARVLCRRATDRAGCERGEAAG